MKKARIIGSCVGLYFLIYGGITGRLSFRAPHSDPYQNCITIDEYLDQALKYHTREFVTYYNQQYLDRTKKLQAAGIEKVPIDRDQIFKPFSRHGVSGVFERFGGGNNTTLACLAPCVKSPVVTRSQLFKLIPPPNHTKMIQDFGRKEDKTPTCIDGRISSNPVFYSIDDFRKHKNKTDFIDGKAFDQRYRIYWFYHFEDYILEPEIRELLYKDGGITSVYSGMFESDFALEIVDIRSYFIWDTFLNEDQKQLYLGSKII